MIKRLYTLSGLAIVAVVINHVCGWGFTAMFWWAFRYRAATVPDFGQLGSPTYYLLVAGKQLTIFSVPTFLFVSGFFVAYAARDSRAGFSWKWTRTRVFQLLLPYLVWTFAIFASNALQGTRFPPVEYVRRILEGGASEGYYYIVVICQLYLFAPVLVPLAKAHPRQLLAVAGAVQLIVLTLNYLSLLGITSAVPDWLFAPWIMFFTLGLVGGFHLERLKRLLGQFRRHLLIILIPLGALAIVEPELVFRLTGRDWRGGINTLFALLYAGIALLCLLAIEDLKLPGTRALQQLSSRTMGIYLISPLVLEYTSKLLYHAAPWLLAQEILLLPLLFGAGVGLPLLLMNGFAHSPARRYYGCLFG